MHTTNHDPGSPTASRRRSSRALLAALTAVGIVAVAAGVAMAHGPSTSDATHAEHADHTDHAGHEMRAADQAAAMVATARFQDVEVAEAAGWSSTIDTLGCFQDATKGGMGVHYLNDALMDDVVDATKPEALVYELDAQGNIIGLVAHEYIVPVDAWTRQQPPRLFGMNFHRHPVLPLWVLHTWIWKTNPTGVFSDWNPAVRPCPDGVPIFGVDLPK